MKIQAQKREMDKGNKAMMEEIMKELTEEFAQQQKDKEEQLKTEKDQLIQENQQLKAENVRLKEIVEK